MTIAKGIAKVLAYKKEPQWGELPGTTDAQELRRISANFDLVKEVYESNEIRPEKQLLQYEHGVRSAEGTLSGELTHKAYSDFMASILARDFGGILDSAILSLTISASGSDWVISRSTGSWFTDNVKIGMVVKLIGNSLNAANTNKHLLVMQMTASDLTVRVLSGASLAAEGPIANSRVSPVGNQTFVPWSNHTDDSYTIEQWFSDIEESEVFTGLKVQTMQVSLPSTGLATVDFGFVGKDLTTKGSTQYFANPSGKTTEGAIAAVNGAVVVNGTPVAVITSADFTVERTTENAAVVGSDVIVDIFTGRIRVSGSLSVYFQDATFRNYFDTESDIALILTLTTSSENESDFISFTFPRIRINSFVKNDAEMGLVASANFVAILNGSSTNGLPSTSIQVQYSAPIFSMLTEAGDFLVTEDGDNLLLG